MNFECQAASKRKDALGPLRGGDNAPRRNLDDPEGVG